MKKLLKTRFMCLLLALIMGLSLTTAAPEGICAAATSKTISVSAFAKKIQNASGVDVLKNSNVTNAKKATTVQIAAYLLERADYETNGGIYSYDDELYYRIKHYNRISDIKKAKSVYRDSLYMCFTKGIMIGKSNGKFSQTRKFTPTAKITPADANKLVKRLSDKSKRFKLSYDGQVIRTTNLPKNYKEYPYILASFPNSFYEKKMWFTKQRKKGYYDTAKQTSKALDDEDKDLICDMVRKNLELRLNVDYRKTFTNKWKSELAETYYNPDSVMSDINTYVKNAKQRKVIISSSKIVVDPSTMWDDNGAYIVKVYAKFKVKSGSVPSSTSKTQNEVIFGNYISMKNLSSHKTVTFEDELLFNISFNPNNKRIYIYGLEDDSLTN